MWTNAPLAYLIEPFSMAFAMMNMDIDFITPGCLIPWNFANSFWLALSLPLVFVVCNLFLLSVARIYMSSCKFIRHRPPQRQKAKVYVNPAPKLGKGSSAAQPQMNAKLQLLKAILVHQVNHAPHQGLTNAAHGQPTCCKQVVLMHWCRKKSVQTDKQQGISCCAMVKAIMARNFIFHLGSGILGLPYTEDAFQRFLDKRIKDVFGFLVIIYNVLCVKCFQAFACMDMPDGSKVCMTVRSHGHSLVA